MLIVAVLTERVPIVAVPVDAVRFEPNVIAPSCNGIVAVLMVAVPIVAVLAERVPIVAVPVDAVMLDPKVDGPETERVPMVAVPVEAVRLVPKVTGPERVVLLETVKDPVLCTPEVDKDSAEDVLSPSVIT